jgi:acyl-CoA thioesterase FadM
MIAQVLGWRGSQPVGELIPSAERAPRAAPVPVALDRTDTVASHGFDGHWFVLRLIPTYDDTNSVGNVYFANYVRWVGKARELFFNICMPNFDLKSTDFYILTKSFHHDFRREAMEFEPVTIRISIASHNRKFVTLAHEIHSEVNGLLGRGGTVAHVRGYGPLPAARYPAHHRRGIPAVLAEIVAARGRR